MINPLKMSHWIGLIQADGHIRQNKDGKIRAIEFTNTNKDLIKTFCRNCKILFGSYPKIVERKDNDSYYCGVYQIENKSDLFNYIDFNDPPKPPIQYTKTNSLFGSYLAGVIDGDGDIRIKRKTYPQCTIRISSSLPQNDLKDYIERFLKCKSSICRCQVLKNGKIWKKWYALEFYVSSKNYIFIKKHIIPRVVSKYKKTALKNFIESKF